MKKIIFLDIDGVVATEKCWRTSTVKLQTFHYAEFGYSWDEDCVRRLNEILEVTNAEIVFSSAWRIGYNHERGNIKSLFDYNKVNKVPIDVTPSHMKKMSGWADRGEEIREWLANNEDKWDNFIILDDDIITGFGECFIPCDPPTGITEEIKIEAIKLLNTMNSDSKFMKGKLSKNTITN